jgi:hypothetical protein
MECAMDKVIEINGEKLIDSKDYNDYVKEALRGIIGTIF